MTDAADRAMSLLRNTDNMQWYVVPLFVSVVYIYFVEIEKKNWNAVLLGIAFWAAEFIWEMFNSLILHFSDYAPLWSTPGKSAFIIYVGLNIEITFFFAVYGVLTIKVLPEDKNMKILSIPNRIFIPVILGLTGAFVEVLLNKCDLLIWDWSFWGWPHCYLNIIGYCAPMLLLVWIHDNTTLKTKKMLAVIFPILAICCHIVLANILKWV